MAGGLDVGLMITDYAMPDMTGLELAREVQRRRPLTLVLLATGFSDLDTAQRVDLPRLTKPYRQQQLATHISRLLRNQKP